MHDTSKSLKIAHLLIDFPYLIISGAANGHRCFWGDFATPTMFFGQTYDAFIGPSGP